MNLPKFWAKNFTAVFRILLFWANMPHIGHFQPFQIWTYYTSLDQKFHGEQLFQQKRGLKMNILAYISRFWSFWPLNGPKRPNLTKTHTVKHTQSLYMGISYTVRLENSLWMIISREKWSANAWSSVLEPILDSSDPKIFPNVTKTSNIRTNHPSRSK